MKQLELKHLAGYLPHKLNIVYNKEVKELIGLVNWVGWSASFKSLHGQTNVPIAHVKPILRHLSTINKQDCKELFELVFGREFPDNGGIVFIGKKTALQTPRFVLSSGVDRLGVQLNGEVWHDCDLHPYKFNQHLITDFFCKKHIDIYELIESELAVDINTLDQTK